MSTPYEAAGRTGQKKRTRDALVAAARALVAEGLVPTIEDAAAGADISRTTAYRYFPSQRLLLAAAHPETATESLLPAEPPTDPLDRLDAVLATFLELVLAGEGQQRTMLRLSLEQGRHEDRPLPLRQGRAIGWFTEALSPVGDRFSPDQLHRLVLAIRSATGIEALVWLTDVAGLTSDQAGELMRWTGRALLQAALDHEPPPC